MTIQPSFTGQLTLGNLNAYSAQSNVYALQYVRSGSANNKLDPIVEQIAVKTEDSVLKVVKLYESGAVARFWEAQKKEPAATWLGNLLDRFLGWGNYYPPAEKAAAISRSLFENSDENEPKGCNETWRETATVNVTTAFDVQTYPNHTCAFVNLEEYIGSIWKNAHYVPKGYEDIMCRIEECIKDNLEYCQPNCLPCQNATETERSKFWNGSWVVTTGGGKHIYGLLWYLDVQCKEDCNKWKTHQVFDMLFNTAWDCEAGALPKDNPLSIGWYVLPIVACGAITIFYFICRPKPPNPDYIPLPDQLDTLPESINDA